jgi:CheY-like chemotaxis protein
VFDSFRQAESSTRRPHPGLGLGLAIVRHLVELHGGSVEAASEGLGQGAAFTVRLPAGAPSGAPSPTAPQRAHIAGPNAGRRVDLSSASILVVDDDADSRDLLTTLLRQYGASVIDAPSAAAALNTLARTPVNLVISDISMPNEDGYDLVRRIRALPDARKASVRTIALTAFARDADRRQAVAAGYDSHISKPVDPQHLVATVTALLAAPRQD